MHPSDQPIQRNRPKSQPTNRQREPIIDHRDTPSFITVHERQRAEQAALSRRRRLLPEEVKPKTDAEKKADNILGCSCIVLLVLFGLIALGLLVGFVALVWSGAIRLLKG